MIERVVTGGQTGVDQAAWRAARALGIATGGWVPRGYLTEDGPQPEELADFGAREHESTSWDARTEANVRDSDATLLFQSETSGPGVALTRAIARRLRRPCLRIDPDRIDDCPCAEVERVAQWITTRRVRILNVAGDRESVAPGIGPRAERYLNEVLRRALRDAEGPR